MKLIGFFETQKLIEEKKAELKRLHEELAINLDRLLSWFNCRYNSGLNKE